MWASCIIDLCICFFYVLFYLFVYLSLFSYFLQSDVRPTGVMTEVEAKPVSVRIENATSDTSTRSELNQSAGSILADQYPCRPMISVDGNVVDESPSQPA